MKLLKNMDSWSEDESFWKAMEPALCAPARVALAETDAVPAQGALRLRKAGLIDEERIALLLSWKHTGFSVHNSVSVQPDDVGATERLVRYLMGAPVSQQRLDLDPDLTEVRLQPKAAADNGRAEDEIANAARAKRERDGAAGGRGFAGGNRQRVRLGDERARFGRAEGGPQALGEPEQIMDEVEGILDADTSVSVDVCVVY